MKTYIDPLVRARIRRAWGQLSAGQRARLEPLVEASRRELALVQSGKLHSMSTLPHQALLLHAALTDDEDGSLSALELGIVFDVTGVGEIIGTGKYEQLDPGWAESLAEWLEHFITGIHGFSDNPVVQTIPDQVKIAIAGDWGTGNWRTKGNPSPSVKVGAQIASQKPDITIHLGDVYYSGIASEEMAFLQCSWPAGAIGAFTLNSNHEMYSGAGPYFKAIGSAPFQLQKGCSYFALENKNWVIVALDSAYYSDRWTMYKDGALFNGDGGNRQVDFLKAQIAKGKKIIILTHHHGLTPDSTRTTLLWSHVMNAFPKGSGPAYWYWGHVHAAAVYKGRDPGNVQCRCCGHAALPWGQAPNLANPGVQWYESRNAGDPDILERVLNGFAVLALDGSVNSETFYDENGGIAWP